MIHATGAVDGQGASVILGRTVVALIRGSDGREWHADVTVTDAAAGAFTMVWTARQTGEMPRGTDLDLRMVAVDSDETYPLGTEILRLY